MSSDQTVVLVFIMSALLLSQAVFILFASLGIRVKLSKFQIRSQVHARRLFGLLRQIQSEIEKIQPALERLPYVESRVRDNLENVRGALVRVDAVAGNALRELRSNVEFLTEESDRALILFSHVTHQVQEAAARPSHRLSSALSSLHSRIPGWKKKRSGRPGDQDSEEQLFI